MAKALLLVPGADKATEVDFPNKEVSENQSNLALYYQLIGCSMITVAHSITMGGYDAVIVLDDEGLYNGPVDEHGIRQPALYNGLATGLLRLQLGQQTSPLVGTALLVQGDDEGNLFGFEDKELAEVKALLSTINLSDPTPQEISFIARFV